MSEIDIERLKVDESLWPEGATHYIIDESGILKSEFHVETHEGFKELDSKAHWPKESPDINIIPRPTKQEWEGGLPNPGDLVRHPRYAEPCTLKWIGKAMCVIESNFGDEYFAAVEDLEPPKSKEQRQREELERLVFAYSDFSEEIADDILSRYNLEEK